MVVVLGIDVHKDSHTAVAVDAVAREVGQRRVWATEAGHRQLLRGALRSFDGVELRFAVEDCRHVSTRLERALLAAGQQVVRVPPGRWPGHGLRRARVESPIRLTRWPPPGPCCASLTYRSLPMRGCHGRSSCWLITGRTWWPAAPGCRTRGAGTEPAKGERQDHDDLSHARGVRERTWRPIALASAT
jgi:transposase